MRGVGGNSVSGREGRVYMRGVGGNSVRGGSGRYREECDMRGVGGKSVYMRGVGGNSVRGSGREGRVRGECEG